MITIEHITHADGKPGVSLRFPYVEPTLEIIKLVEEAGLTDAFRSVSGQYVLTDEEMDLIKPEKVEGYLTAKAKSMLLSVGEAILADDEKRAQAKADTPDVDTPDVEAVPADDVEVL